MSLKSPGSELKSDLLRNGLTKAIRVNILKGLKRDTALLNPGY